MVSTTTDSRAATWLPVRMGLPWAFLITHRSHGVGTSDISPARAPSQMGMKNPMAARPVATARVTTERMSRGEREKRRMMVMSTSTATRGPPIRAMGATSR